MREPSPPAPVGAPTGDPSTDGPSTDGSATGAARLGLSCRGLVPEVYLRTMPGREALDRAFAAAFHTRRPAIFEADDATFLDLLTVQPLARAYRVARHGLAARLDIHVIGEIDAVPPLLQLAALLNQPLIVDIGLDITDDTALLVAPDGSVSRGDFPDLAAAVLRCAGQSSAALG